MAQHDMNLADAAGIAFRADLNNALAALVGQNSGATAPTTTYPYMWWADIASGWLKQRNGADNAWLEKLKLADATTAVGASLLSAATVAAAQQAMDVEVGVDVQAFDVDTAKLDVDQTWTGAQRGTITTDNDGNFDQNVTNKFKCEPTGAVAITFTNHTAGQGGTVIFRNTSNYTITAAATTYIASADLTKLSATGYYLIGYEDDGTNAYCTVSAPLTSAGA